MRSIVALVMVIGLSQSAVFGGVLDIPPPDVQDVQAAVAACKAYLSQPSPAAALACADIFEADGEGYLYELESWFLEREYGNPTSEAGLWDTAEGLAADAADLHPQAAFAYGTYAAAVLQARQLLGVDAHRDAAKGELDAITVVADALILDDLNEDGLSPIFELTDSQVSAAITRSCSVAASRAAGIPSMCPVVTMPWNPALWIMATEERRVCASQPYDCGRAAGAASDAYEWSHRRYQPPTYDGKNDRKDAYRHCMWNALMTKRSNRGFAAKMSEAHENENPSKPASREMDMHNNYVGRNIGVTSEGKGDVVQPNQGCFSAAGNGTLWIIRGPGKNYP